MIGDEFKTARNLLLEHLEGNIAWKDPAHAEKQKQRLAERKAEATISEAIIHPEDVTTEQETVEEEINSNYEIQM